MDLYSRVTEDDILSKLYADNCSDVADDEKYEREILDSDFSTTSSDN
jgi:hypothetical protein